MGTRHRNGKVWDAPSERKKPRGRVPEQLGRTNSKGHVKTFLKHANIAGMRQEDFNVSFAICPGFVVLGDALLPVAGPSTIDGFKAYK